VLHKGSNGGECLGKSSGAFPKDNLHPFQELLKFVGVIPKEEEEVAMGMDNPNDLDYRERENLHEEEPFYEEGPLEPGVNFSHCVFCNF